MDVLENNGVGVQNPNDVKELEFLARRVGTAGIPADEEAAYIYLMMKRQGIFDRVFYEQSLSLTEFMKIMLAPETSFIVCTCERPDADVPQFIGCAWVNSMRLVSSAILVKAEVGFSFDVSVPLWDRIRGGRAMLDWAFENLAIDVLFGTTPEPNKAAVAFAKRIGMNVVATLPNYTVFEGEIVPAVISQVTRTEYYEEGEDHGRTE